MKADEEKAFAWLAGDDTGASSRCILFSAMRVPIKRHDYPHDPADLGRCLRLLALFPHWPVERWSAALVSPNKPSGIVWRGLVERWDELAKTMADEVGIDWSKGRQAPATYALLKRVIDSAIIESGEFECHIREDGSLGAWSWPKEVASCATP